MPQIKLRIITGILAGLLFFTCYLFSPQLFIVLLASIGTYILIYEWPLLKKAFSNSLFWPFTLFYPILPFAAFIMLVMQFYHLNPFVPIYPFLATWIGDTAAYFVGRSFGENKICPSISPGKSWEGLLGGFFGIFAFNIFYVPYCVPFLGASKDHIIMYAVVVTGLGFLGDIFVSWMKRRVRLKDTGIILPGHGGLLDRFDSVMFVGVIFFIYISALS